MASWLAPWAAELQRLYPQLQLTSGRRSRASQTRLYRRFLAGQADFPVAPPGKSKHELGRAFDMIAPPAVLRSAGDTWESWGGRWGGRFNDPIHFEA